eukprot:c7231_g1_i1.p1 GENE.c7231_g1_i1~~c7231_g1_i1.p1  ORF type:complete len:628 (+),score=142.24 c7231_g1_i1:33-1886(+)
MRVLLSTMNLGGYFDAPDLQLFTSSFAEPFYQIVQDVGAQMIVLHIQEVGGKSKDISLVHPVMKALRSQFPVQEFSSSGLLCDLSSDEFIGLGTIVFVRIPFDSVVKAFDYAHNRAVAIKELQNMASVTKFRRFCHQVRVPFGPRKSRKGFLLTEWILPDVARPISMVNIHLLHDESNLVATVESFPSQYSIRRMRALHDITSLVQSDIAFLFGDFNFRLDLSSFVPWISDMEDFHQEELDKLLSDDTVAPQGYGVTRSLKADMEALGRQTSNLDYTAKRSSTQLFVAVAGMAQAAPIQTSRLRVSFWNCCSSSAAKNDADGIELPPSDLTETQLANLTRTFQHFDVDGNGRLSVEELSQCLVCIGVVMSKEEIHHMMHVVDGDKSGDIDLKEFFNMIQGRLKEQIGESRRKTSMLINDGSNQTFKVRDKESDASKDVGIERAANEEMAEAEVHNIKKLTNKSKSVTLEAKKFTFDHVALLTSSAQFRRLVTFFDKELALFNDCRAELKAPPLIELRADFPPTFPVERATGTTITYASTRAPAWCDRVLMTGSAFSKLSFSENTTAPQPETSFPWTQNVFGVPKNYQFSGTSGSAYFTLNTGCSDHTAVFLLADIHD